MRQPDISYEQNQNFRYQVPESGQQNGFFASVLKSTGLGNLAGYVNNQNGEPRQSNENSVANSNDQVAHFGGPSGQPAVDQAVKSQQKLGEPRQSIDFDLQHAQEPRFTYNPFTDFPNQRGSVNQSHKHYENLATEQRADDTDYELKDPTYNFERNTQSHAKDKLRQSQEFHRLKIQQEKNKKIRGRILGEIEQTDRTKQNLANNFGLGDASDRQRDSRRSWDAQQDTLTKLGEQLSALNANL